MNLLLTQPNNNRLNDLIKWSWRENRPMAVFGVASIIYLLLALIGLFIDPRAIINEPAWLKPAKFGISSIFYTYTFLWMLTYIEGRRWLVSIVSLVTAIGLTVELVLIGYQAARGVRSHFNFTTQFDGVIFVTMGIFILTVWIASVIAAIILVRQKFTSRPFGLSLKLGMVIAVIGAGMGNMMTTPTVAQMEEMQERRGPSEFIGAHTVGAEDGGARLPLVGWSTEGGDMRVGHFFGLHGLQALPLVGWLMLQQRRRWTESQQMRFVWIAGFAYAGLIAITTWQSLRGQSIIAPDWLTLNVAFGWFSTLTIATFATIRGK